MKDIHGEDKGLIYHPLDVTSDKSVGIIVDFVERELTHLDVLINNAAIHYDSEQKAIDADLLIVEQALQTNLMGAWRMSKAFIPLMKKKEYGRIVNVSSGAGALHGMGGGSPAYGSISKAALNALTIKLAAELKDTGILVNAQFVQDG
jgi:NAD(P)-dependent dehydrogenase (short-subunit alcohol dehydrogenase family)